MDKLAVPDSLTEIKRSAESLLQSIESLFSAAKNYNSSEIINFSKNVKNNMRQLFGVINVGKPSSTNSSNYSVIQNKALNLNYLIKDLILASNGVF